MHAPLHLVHIRWDGDGPDAGRDAHGVSGSVIAAARHSRDSQQQNAEYANFTALSRDSAGQAASAVAQSAAVSAARRRFIDGAQSQKLFMHRVTADGHHDVLACDVHVAGRIFGERASCTCSPRQDRGQNRQ